MPDTPVGDNSPDYPLVSADLGATIYCKVTATNASGTANADSNTVGPVTAPAAALPAAVTAFGEDTFTSGALNTTGATFLIVTAGSYASVPVITDSMGNTWNEIANPELATIFWCRPTTVGPGHTVTATGTDFYCSLTFAAFAYAAIASPVDETDSGGGTASTTATLLTGVTPTQNNELVIITGRHLGSSGEEFGAITGGFTMFPSVPPVAATCLGHRTAYLLQTTAALANPSWTISGAVDSFLYAATFKNA